MYVYKQFNNRRTIFMITRWKTMIGTEKRWWKDQLQLKYHLILLFFILGAIEVSNPSHIAKVRCRTLPLEGIISKSVRYSWCLVEYLRWRKYKRTQIKYLKEEEIKRPQRPKVKRSEDEINMVVHQRFFGLGGKKVNHEGIFECEFESN